ncbi:MAG: DUF3638 domain-containing protein [Parachlamydiaceae bacterium]|nr:DUF3638 domain-containing protein [Parachlamydiaceae bacterium]
MDNHWNYCKNNCEFGGLEQTIDACSELNNFFTATTNSDEQLRIAHSFIICLSAKTVLSNEDIRNLVFYQLICSRPYGELSGGDPLICVESQRIIWKYIVEIDLKVSNNPNDYLNPVFLFLTGTHNTSKWIREECGFYRTEDSHCIFNILKKYIALDIEIGKEMSEEMVDKISGNFKLFLKPTSVVLSIHKNGENSYKILTEDKQQYHLIKQNYSSLSYTILKKKIDDGLWAVYTPHSLLRHFPIIILKSWIVWTFKKDGIHFCQIADKNDHPLYLISAPLSVCQGIDAKDRGNTKIFNYDNVNDIKVEKIGEEPLFLLKASKRAFTNEASDGPSEITKKTSEMKVNDSPSVPEEVLPCYIHEQLYKLVDVDEVFIWGDESHLPRLIEIPRFNLNFKPKFNASDEVRWESLEFPEYYLDKNSYVEPLVKLFFKKFIVLRTTDGLKKILLKSPFADYSNNYISYDYNLAATSNKRELHIKGNLEKITLAHIAIKSGSTAGYLLARTLLQTPALYSQELTEEELSALTSIIQGKKEGPETGDPRDTALRLKACEWITRAADIVHNQEILNSLDDNFIDWVLYLLEHYAKVYQHLSGFLLAPDTFARLCFLHEKYRDEEGGGGRELSDEIVTLLAHSINEVQSLELKQFIVNLLEEFKSMGMIEMFELDELNEHTLEKLFLKTSSQNQQTQEIVQANTNKQIFLTRRVSYLFLNDALRTLYDLSTVKNDFSIVRKKFRLLKGKAGGVYISFLENLLNNLEINNLRTLKVQNLLKQFIELQSSTSEDLDEIKKRVIKEMLTFNFDCSKQFSYKIISAPPISYSAHRPENRSIPCKNMTTGLQFLQSSHLQKKNYNSSLLTPLLSGCVDAQVISGQFLTDHFSKLPGRTIKSYYEQRCEHVKNGAFSVLDLPQKLSPIGNILLTRLRNGIQKYPFSDSSYEQTFEIIDLDKFVKELKSTISEKNRFLESLEEELNVIAKKQTLSFNSRRFFDYEKYDGQQIHLTLMDLIFLYAKNSLSSLHQIDGVNTLEKKLETFLLLSTETQKWKRCLEKAKGLKDMGEGSQGIQTQKIVKEMSCERVYDHLEYPSFLVLEYAANILIRKDQLDKLLSLLPSKNSASSILQMLPGAGKTSVLMKILALVYADGKNLSMVVLPEELFYSMQKEIVESGSYFFNQLILPLEITRKMGQSAEAMKKISYELRNIIEIRGAVIAPPSTIHTLYLLYIESISTFNVKNSEDLQRIGHLRDILNILKYQCHVLIDEVDSVLDCSKRVNFSWGKALHLTDEEIDLTVALYHILLTYEEISGKIKLNFYRINSMNEAPPFTEKAYLAIKPVIAEKAMEYLCSKYEQLKRLKRSEQKALMAFLLQTGEHQSLTMEEQVLIEQGNACVAKMDDIKIKNSLALLKEQLTSLLLETLQAVFGESYGFSKISEKPLVIPYDKGKPCEGFRFGNPHIAANYTIQSALCYGMPENTVDTVLNEIKEDILKEILLGKDLRATKGYQFFKRIWKGVEEIHPLTITPEQQVNIHQEMNANLDTIECVTKKYLLQSIQFHEQKYSSPVSMLPYLFGEKIKGFSGTLWNSDTFPAKINCTPDYDMDSKTICLLLENCQNEAGSLAIANKENAEAVFDALEKFFDKGIAISALIDGGGYLNRECPYEMAKNWQKRVKERQNRDLDTESPPQGILCHDKDSKLFLQKPDGTITSLTTELPVDQRLTIFRQPFTIGTDIHLPPKAVGVVTIGQSVLLRDIIQNVRRMRQLDERQKALFMVSKDVRTLIASTLQINQKDVDIKSILKFSIINQIKCLEKDSAMSVRGQMLSIIQAEILNTMLQTEISPEELKIFIHPSIEKIFSPIQSMQAWDMYGQISVHCNTVEVLSKEAERIILMLKEAMEHSPKLKKHVSFGSIIKKIEQLSTTQLMPETLLTNPTEHLREQVKIQIKTQENVKLHTQDQEASPIEPLTSWRSHNWMDSAFLPSSRMKYNNFGKPEPHDYRPFGFFPFSSYLNPLSFNSSIFSPFLFTSTNFACPKNFGANSPFPFGENQKRIELMMIIEEVGNNQPVYGLVFVDDNDAAIARKLEKMPVNVCLYDLFIGPLRCGEQFNLNGLQTDNNVRLALLQAKLLAGNWQFSEEELNLLKNWASINGHQEIAKLFKEVIYKHYEESDLLLARIAPIFQL